MDDYERLRRYLDENQYTLEAALAEFGTEVIGAHIDSWWGLSHEEEQPDEEVTEEATEEAQAVAPEVQPNVLERIVTVVWHTFKSFFGL